MHIIPKIVKEATIFKKTGDFTEFINTVFKLLQKIKKVFNMVRVFIFL